MSEEARLRSLREILTCDEARLRSLRETSARSWSTEWLIYDEDLSEGPAEADKRDARKKAGPRGARGPPPGERR